MPMQCALHITHSAAPLSHDTADLTRRKRILPL